MKRTISVMLGKGSVNHNGRKFKAANIDSERTQFNVTYSDTPIKDVYHELFDAALKRYNEKQTRSDRRIDDYYEKIRTGKQEKLFYEVIFQVGNIENMASISEDGQLAAMVLDDFMKDFQERNSNLKVFSAHLHMDEATPHLHVDFVPFITGSKRGLDTRVSLKQALAAQGFTGGTRGATEWNQWVKSEKEQLSQVMERHGIEWEKLGTNREHLSVLNFKKEQRVEEVERLDKAISGKKNHIALLTEKEDDLDARISDMESVCEQQQEIVDAQRKHAEDISNNVHALKLDDDWDLPLPLEHEMAGAYHRRAAWPLVETLKNLIRGMVEKVEHYKDRLERMTRLKDRYKGENEQLKASNKRYGLENRRLKRALGYEESERVLYGIENETGKRRKGRHYVR